jgi:23S rRNA (pseudouridine1915-N3)-methyltransferase
MQLSVIAVGRLKDGPERDLCERYRARAVDAGRAMGFSGPLQAEIAESRARRPDDRRIEEANLIRARLPSGLTILLDERGAALDSQAFAGRLAAARDQGTGQASFVIGGADGLDPSLRSGASLVLSFGALTLPHQLVRALVFEQIYRALTILAGHPYHRQ